MLKIVTKDGPGGHYRPMAFCDVCGVEIPQASDANVLFTSAPAGRGAEFRMEHRACSPVGDRRAWMPLAHFLVYLSRNLGVPWGDERTAEGADTLGSL